MNEPRQETQRDLEKKTLFECICWVEGVLEGGRRYEVVLILPNKKLGEEEPRIFDEESSMELQKRGLGLSSFFRYSVTIRDGKPVWYVGPAKITDLPETYRRRYEAEVQGVPDFGMSRLEPLRKIQESSRKVV